LDHFKDINDTLGHDKGDELLREVASRIKSCASKTDTVARLGGDEFAIILSKCGDNKAAAAIAQQITQKLNKPFKLRHNRADHYILHQYRYRFLSARRRRQKKLDEACGPGHVRSKTGRT
jgi:diguanylate cyclase (GGDEF)-like protein